MPVRFSLHNTRTASPVIGKRFNPVPHSSVSTPILLNCTGHAESHNMKQIRPSRTVHVKDYCNQMLPNFTPSTSATPTVEIGVVR